GGHNIGFFDIAPDKPGCLFENLITDILNEKKQCASHARLLEDILEQTDVRVTYRNLERKNGARLQVGLQSRSQSYEEKLSKLHLRDEFVILSPIELAYRCLKSQGSEYLEEMDWISFWKQIGEREWDVEALAYRLKALFFAAFKYAPNYPMGALQALPEDLRKLIRLIVKYRAFDVTKNLRSREQIRGTFRPSSRDIGK
ncbi:hypothetical protein N9195_01555, partial [bacterium]|nr:hypothetical protein [bacterium]